MTQNTSQTPSLYIRPNPKFSSHKDHAASQACVCAYLNSTFSPHHFPQALNSSGQPGDAVIGGIIILIDMIIQPILRGDNLEYILRDRAGVLAIRQPSQSTNSTTIAQGKSKT